MQLAYVILPPDEIHNFMRRVQADLYERYDGTMTTFALEPHITLEQPFAAAEVEPHEEFLDQLGLFCQTEERPWIVYRRAKL